MLGIKERMKLIRSARIWKRSAGNFCKSIHPRLLTRRVIVKNAISNSHLHIVREEVFIILIEEESKRGAQVWKIRVELGIPHPEGSFGLGHF